MSKIKLINPKGGVSLIKDFFLSIRKNSNSHFAHHSVRLSVREDICFGNNWLSLGEIILKPSSISKNEEDQTLIEDAIHYGFYEWKMSSYEEIFDHSVNYMKINKDNDTALDKTRRALQAVIDAAMRMGLLFPKFDADIMAEMPFQRPTTIIADTNSIIKGGVDFLIRFLHPMARLKIPAAAALEILNQTDNFISKRRKTDKKKDGEKDGGKKADLFLDHVVSQAGQRALLRFELFSDVEVERNALLPDSLRNLFKLDKEGTKLWSNSNFAVTIKSHFDRLILETARQHLNLVSPGHPVLLMTGDEGLARMSLSEGMQPLFFHAGRPKELYGQILTGTKFNPFSGELFSIPLETLLWELAVTFGNARINSEDGAASLEICAIDEKRNWQPFHAKDDLLPVILKTANSAPIEVSEEQSGLKPIANKSSDSENIPKIPRTSNKTTNKPSMAANTVYDISLDALMEFVPILLEKEIVPYTGKGTNLEGNSKRTISRYFGFLTAGQFVKRIETGIQAEEALLHLWKALSAQDLEETTLLFRKVPSLNDFFDKLQSEKRIQIENRYSPAYIQIAELCGCAVKIPNEFIYGTFSNPRLDEFVEFAINAYEKIRKGEDYVLTGLWLETLVSEYGLHPIKIRENLDEAQAEGMMDRFTQGSTPDTRFDNHTLTLLQIANGLPIVKKICLYHGDFIIPGKASVSITLKRK